MALVLAFGVVLLISVSLSGIAARTVLSTALLFLVAGALLGPGGFGIVTQSAEDDIVAVLAETLAEGALDPAGADGKALGRAGDDGDLTVHPAHLVCRPSATAVSALAASRLIARSLRVCRASLLACGARKDRARPCRHQ